MRLGRSLPARGAWIEIKTLNFDPSGLWSLPARGAWIEIAITFEAFAADWVAPRKGSVD